MLEAQGIQVTNTQAQLSIEEQQLQKAMAESLGQTVDIAPQTDEDDIKRVLEQSSEDEIKRALEASLKDTHQTAQHQQVQDLLPNPVQSCIDLGFPLPDVIQAYEFFKDPKISDAIVAANMTDYLLQNQR